MFLLSVGKQTILSDFNSLEEKSVYKHANDEMTDFQYCGQRRIFIEVNKKCGLELMRIKENLNQSFEIQRVRKLNVESVYSVACPKQSFGEVAFGSSNGLVRLYNYKLSQFIHRFNPERERNAVLFMDYNGNDEYLAAVFEGGYINTYGIKTLTQIDKISIDDSATLARFHPTKRFHLAIASNNGAFTLYDMQLKRKVFNATDAHSAPCRDLAMTANLPHTILTVGYDCVVNLFDTRKKNSQRKLCYNHPLSAVALSDCGNFYVVGNLKGELNCYDMRQTSSALASKQIHENGVTRIQFLPPEVDTEKSNSSAEFMHASSTLEPVEQIKNNCEISRGKRDSFFDFLDIQQTPRVDAVATRLTGRRDSFDWEVLSQAHTNQFSTHNVFEDIFDSKSSEEKENEDARLSMVHRRHGKTSGKLQQILEDSNISSSKKLSKNVTIQAVSSKQSFDMHASKVMEKCSKSDAVDLLDSKSTASESNRDSMGLSHSLASESNRDSRVLSTKENACNIINNSEETKQIDELREEMNTRFSKKIQEEMDARFSKLQEEMDARFKRFEQAIKLNAEDNKWEIFNQNSHIYSLLSQHNFEIFQSLDLLLKADPFAVELARLTAENLELKAKLAQFNTHSNAKD